MGPKKDVKKDAQKREKGADNEKKYSIDDDLNTNSWKCVVVLAVERTHFDSFVLEEFMEECHNGLRKEVVLIDFKTTVMKILKEFAHGELPYKYTFLLNFSSVFQEAVHYIEKKMDIPIFVLVKVVKALLFYLKEEDLMLTKRMATGSTDPIKAMAERPANIDSFSAKKNELTKKGENGLKVRPPSITKENTKLLKRGEKAKYDHCIDDAPRNAYFRLYVLLTGFYNPGFPLELLKANVPLHGILCIDASLSGVKRDSSSEQNAFQKSNSETKPEEIQTFWDTFLKQIWDPAVSVHFKDTIFQMYTPQRLLCEKKKMGEFLYREISYLMYDLSDFKRQLNNYIEHINLWELPEGRSETFIWPENLPEECTSVAILLRCIIDAISEDSWNYRQSTSFQSESINSETEWGPLQKYSVSNKYLTGGSCVEGLGWSQELEGRGDFNLLNVYYKIKELDAKYDLNNQSMPSDNSEKVETEKTQAAVTDNLQSQVGFENAEYTSLSSEGVFLSYWKMYENVAHKIYELDYSLYAFLMTKVLCPYQSSVDTSSMESYVSTKKNSTFELIENLTCEMRKPHFTVTEGSRNILKAAPYNLKNTSKDFFSPEEYKIVSPEKLKASSAPEFRVTPSIKIQTLYLSETFPCEISKNPFEGLRGFLNECLFSNINEFDFLEFLNKPKLLVKEQEHWSNYNCIDHSYFLLNDCIFLRLHNRKDGQNIHHETFNQTLRTAVGLRDFYEYVLEDEANWLAYQEDLYKAQAFLSNTLIMRDSFRDFADSDFWMSNALKFQALNTMCLSNKKPEEIKTEPSSAAKVARGNVTVMNGNPVFEPFEGYDVSNMAVQFSGLKTIYYSSDSSISVELIERLYGNQDLGIHVTEASHSLHLHSYVCPEPHLLDPFTFHVSYKNGVIVAFSRRFIETFEEVEETVESTTTIKSKKNSSEISSRIIKRQVPISVKDENFIYDMAASLPNGLSIKTVRKIVKPCYIKQSYLVGSEEISGLENSRMFLPNGNVIKIMKNCTFQILKLDASIITANLSDLNSDTEEESFSLTKYEIVTGEGKAQVFEQGEVKSSKKFQIFQNTDMSTNQIFFRREDGTDYMLQNDGTLCVQFSDGTKMSSSLLVLDDATEPSDTNDKSTYSSKEEKFFQDNDLDADFVFVFLEVIAEHPDYATVIYNGQTQQWRILLPFDSTITVDLKGNYFVDIDKQTELKVETDFIRMNNFSSEREPQCTFTANLSVFENNEGGVYCHMADSRGKIFIVEANSNCYILNDGDRSEAKDLQEQPSVHVGPKESEASEFIASADLQICPPIPKHKNNKLLPENKYFVLRRDLSGAEVLHKDDVNKALTKKQVGTLVFTQNIPGTENRCFVLVAPGERKKIKKWSVRSIIPDPKYEPELSKKSSSTTYGDPPTWLHPFPKRKSKFVVPQPLTCRVFLETKKTDLSPATGTLECHYCEINELNEAKYSRIPEDGIEEYLKRLSNDDQDLLTEIYSLAAASVIHEKKKLKPTNSEKLERYLELGRYYVTMREYHKKCIRYQTIPNYFHHPAGMSWLILNEYLLLKLKPSDEKARTGVLHRTRDADTSESISDFSDEEIEYNMSPRAEQSFSSLSYRSDLSAQTAPPILRTGGICRCKVNAAKNMASSPVVQCVWKSEISLESIFEEPHVSGICEFQETEIEMLEKKDRTRQRPLMSLEDLMYLGLI